MGRVGADFMDLAKPGLIKEHCLPNAIFTFKEYLNDFADEELITIKLTVSRKDAGGVLKPVAADQTIRLNIKRASFIQKGVC